MGILGKGQRSWGIFQWGQVETEIYWSTGQVGIFNIYFEHKIVRVKPIKGSTQNIEK